MAAYFPGDQIACDDTLGMPINDDQIEHLFARPKRNAACINHPHERLVGAEQQLLPRLATRVERPRYLRTTEGAVVEIAAVLSRKGDALRNTLVNDVYTHFR